MSTMTAESKNKTPTNDPQPKDVHEEIQEVRKQMEVQAATQAGVNATQAATHAGTWSTMLAGAGGLVVGLFLAMAFSATRS